MPNLKGKTVGEARTVLSQFLRDTGCYDICAKCPVYPGGEGCCHECGHLARNEQGNITGCDNANLTCLTYTCHILNEHLRRQGKLEELASLVYGVPKEGYRGCQKRPDAEVLQVQDPLTVLGGVEVRPQEPGYIPYHVAECQTCQQQPAVFSAASEQEEE